MTDFWLTRLDRSHRGRNACAGEARDLGAGAQATVGSAEPRSRGLPALAAQRRCISSHGRNGAERSGGPCGAGLVEGSRVGQLSVTSRGNLFSACSDPKEFGPARRRGWTAAVNAAEHPSPSDRLNSAAEAEPHRRCALRRSSRISSKSPQRMAIDEAGRHLADARAFCTSPAFDPDRGTGVRCARRAPRRREQGDPG